MDEFYTNIETVGATGSKGKDPRKPEENPFMVFLDAVADEPDEEDERKGIASGVKSWLSMVVPQSGSEPASLPTEDQKCPWMKVENTGDDTMTKKAEENMTKIAREFCSWLKDLPGE